jgi:CBS domain-containing protein
MPNYVVPSGRILTTGDFLDVGVRKAMNSGIVAISEEANLEGVYHALVSHRVHAVLVVGAEHGTPLGWATADGLLEYVDKDRSLVSATDAITERPHWIEVRATVRDAINRLSEVGTTHLLVVEREGEFPVGTVSNLDLAAFLGRG